jgi:hypothetical protein
MDQKDRDYVIKEIGVRGMNNQASRGGIFVNWAIEAILHPDEMLDKRFHYLVQ